MATWSEGLGWGRNEQRMFTDIATEDRALYRDRFAQQLFHLGYFDMNADHDTRMRARGYMARHLREEYGVDFDAHFDWAEWRERYGAGEL